MRPMCAVRDSFKHWTAARRRIDCPIRECPVWRKATGGSGSRADIGQWLVSAKSGHSRSETALCVSRERITASKAMTV